MRRIVILGATSGIAQAVQRLCAKNSVDLFLVARSEHRLEAASADLTARGARSVVTLAADLADLSTHARVVDSAKTLLPGFDTVLLAYGSLHDQQQCAQDAHLAGQELHTNFVSAALLLGRFAQHFETMSEPGCLAAITSVAGDRGRSSNYIYGAAKGGLALYMEGLRSRLRRRGIAVITIKPGPTETAMLANADRKLHKVAADVNTVAADIYAALQRRAPHVVYTPRYWRYIMAGVKAIPEPLFARLGL